MCSVIINISISIEKAYPISDKKKKFSNQYILWKVKYQIFLSQIDL